jgi:hypothetical protein
MFIEFKNSFIRWANTTTERQKLQHTYLALTILIILIAGIVSLINVHFGHKLSVVAFASVCVFIINGVVWNLLNSVVISKLPPRPKRK